MVGRCALLLAGLSTLLPAAFVRVENLQRGEVLGGEPFGIYGSGSKRLRQILSAKDIFSRATVSAR